MERLTKVQADGTVYYSNENLSMSDCLKKLCKLEDLEEQNKLIKLQFKPCDKVYLIEEHIEKKGERT